MLLLLQLLNSCLVTILTVFLVKKFPKHVYVVAIVPVIVGVIGMNVVDSVSTRLSDPKVKVDLKEQKPTEITLTQLSNPAVQVNLKELNPGEITLHVQNGPAIAEAVDIDYPLMGNVTNIDHLAPGSMYGSLEKWKNGYDNPYSQNNIKIHIEKLASNGYVTFFISCEQHPPSEYNIEIPRLDIYSYRYTWNHGGKTIEQTRWVSKKTGLEVPRPVVDVMGSIGDPHMSKEELEKLGLPPWRRFE